MWFFVALLANSILATVGIMDKFILTKSVPKPVVFVFYSTIFVLPLFLVFPAGLIGPVAVPTINYLIFAVSGGCFALGLWAMYTAIEKSEVSRIGPLIGAAAPFFILFLGRIFLGEKLSSFSLVGALLLIIGSLVISFDKRSSKNLGRHSVLWAVSAGLFFATSHVSAKYAYDVYGFFQGFIFTKLPIGIFGAMLLLDPDVRAVFNKKPHTTSTAVSKKNQIILVSANMVLGVVGTVLLQYATFLGSVSLVNAMAGVQYALLLVFTALISKFFPKIIKEQFTRQVIIHKTLAVLIIGVGLGLILFK